MSEQKTDIPTTAAEPVLGVKDVDTGITDVEHTTEMTALKHELEVAHVACEIATSALEFAYQRYNKLLQDQLRRRQRLYEYRATMQTHKAHIAILCQQAKDSTSAVGTLLDITSPSNTITTEPANTVVVASDLPIMLAGFYLYRMKLMELRLEQVMVRKGKACDVIGCEVERRRDVAMEKKTAWEALGRVLKGEVGGDSDGE